MKLNKERIAWLRKVLETADYCHIGKWGGEETWDVQGDLEDALDDIAHLEAELAGMKLMEAEAFAEGIVPENAQLRLRSVSGGEESTDSWARWNIMMKKRIKKV